MPACESAPSAISPSPPTRRGGGGVAGIPGPYGRGDSQRPSAPIARPSAFPPKGMGATSGGGHGGDPPWRSAHSHTRGRRWRGGTRKAPTARRVTPGGLVRRNRPSRFPHRACGKSARPLRRKAAGRAPTWHGRGWAVVVRSRFWGDKSNWCTDAPAGHREHTGEHNASTYLLAAESPVLS